MRSFDHTCTHCGQKDQIERSIALGCPKCTARPGVQCRDLRPLVPTTLTRPHPERIQLVREADEAYRSEAVSA
jgi:predicted  nucleic acid-binding Zn-ribbon protein